MEAYVMELTHLVEEVYEAGVALDDEELTLIALNGLDTSYDAFVTVQKAWANEISYNDSYGKYCNSEGGHMPNLPKVRSYCYLMLQSPQRR